MILIDTAEKSVYYKRTGRRSYRKSATEAIRREEERKRTSSRTSRTRRRILDKYFTTKAITGSLITGTTDPTKQF